MADQNVLLVEGIQDAFVVYQVCRKNNIRCVIQRSGRVIEGDEGRARLFIIPMEGVDNRDTFIVERIGEFSDTNTLSVVVDADSNPHGRMASVADHFATFSGRRPFQPDELLGGDGWIGTVESETGRDIRAGLWVMPDNDSAGAIEDFAIHLIEQDDEIWPYSKTVVDNKPGPEIQEGYRVKTELGIWICLQPGEPDLRLGINVAKNRLDVGADLAQRFVAWVKTLFNSEIE